MGGWDGRDFARIAIDPALPCSVSGCGRPAAHAVAERDETFPELWRLLPVCDACARRLTAFDHNLRSGSGRDIFATRH